jgi:hypothetical protein
LQQAGATVKNCSNRGEVSAAKYAGGIAGSGYLSAGVVACYNAGPVSVNNYYTAGGIVGRNHQNLIRACYNTGGVSGPNGIGGIAGENSGAEISACYSTGSVTGNADMGGVVGLSDCIYGTSTLTDCYFDNFAGNGIGATVNEAVDAGYTRFSNPAFWPAFGSSDWTAEFWKSFSSGEYPRLVWEKN